MLELFLKKIIGLLRLSGSLATKSMSLNNEQCETRSALFDLNSVELNCYRFIINVDKCNKTCNNLTKISGRICVPNKTEELNLILINMITRKQELITLKNIVSLMVQHVTQSKAG